MLALSWADIFGPLFGLRHLVVPNGIDEPVYIGPSISDHQKTGPKSKKWAEKTGPKISLVPYRGDSYPGVWLAAVLAPFTAVLTVVRVNS